MLASSITLSATPSVLAVGSRRRRALQPGHRPCDALAGDGELLRKVGGDDAAVDRRADQTVADSPSRATRWSGDRRGLGSPEPAKLGEADRSVLAELERDAPAPEAAVTGGRARWRLRSSTERMRVAREGALPRVQTGDPAVHQLARQQGFECQPTLLLAREHFVDGKLQRRQPTRTTSRHRSRFKVSGRLVRTSTESFQSSESNPELAVALGRVPA